MFFAVAFVDCRLKTPWTRLIWDTFWLYTFLDPTSVILSYNIRIPGAKTWMGILTNFQADFLNNELEWLYLQIESKC